MYLQHIDRHLDGEAAKWVLNTPSVRVLIYRGYMDAATESDVDDFHRALSDHFKLTDKEIQDHFRATPWQGLMRLRQRTGEDLVHYYGRAQDLLLALHDRDAEKNGDDALPAPEISLRDTVVCRFVLGLSGKKLKYSLYQQHVHHHTMTLHQAFKMAEAQLKIIHVATRSDERQEETQQQGGKKRKAPTDGEEADEETHKIVTLKVPTTAKGNESRERATSPTGRISSANLPKPGLLIRPEHYLSNNIIVLSAEEAASIPQTWED